MERRIDLQQNDQFLLLTPSLPKKKTSSPDSFFLLGDFSGRETKQKKNLVKMGQWKLFGAWFLWVQEQRLPEVTATKERDQTPLKLAKNLTT